MEKQPYVLTAVALAATIESQDDARRIATELFPDIIKMLGISSVDEVWSAGSPPEIMALGREMADLLKAEHHLWVVMDLERVVLSRYKRHRHSKAAKTLVVITDQGQLQELAGFVKVRAGTFIIVEQTGPHGSDTKLVGAL